MDIESAIDLYKYYCSFKDTTFNEPSIKYSKKENSNTFNLKNADGTVAFIHKKDNGNIIIFAKKSQNLFQLSARDQTYYYAQQ